MTTNEIITIVIAVFSLIVSGFTAYRTLLTRFNARVYLKPRAWLTNYSNSPSIIVGCEIENLGSNSGSIDDLVLLIRYHKFTPNSVNKYSFVPLFIRNEYNLFASYTERDFEPFVSISIGPNSRVTRYIVFQPTDPDFTPAIGEIELYLCSRHSSSSKWNGTKTSYCLPVDSTAINNWTTPGKTVMLESKENDKFRDALWKREF